MWGGVSELDLPYEVRHIMRFKDKHQRPLTDREKEIIEKVKAGIPGQKPNRYVCIVIAQYQYTQTSELYVCPSKRTLLVMTF